MESFLPLGPDLWYCDPGVVPGSGIAACIPVDDYQLGSIQFTGSPEVLSEGTGF
jgi:hypothetical protein